jgi:TetR/AcrR family transcriptional repressor of nem operon
MRAMGHSREDKTRSHERIVEIASGRFREAGIDGPGVAEIMRAAGLTHGGFYRHFESRDDLVAEAVEHALASNESWLQSVLRDADDPLSTFVEWYTSAEHCDDRAGGCGVVALGCDAARSDDRVRAAYREQVQRYLGHLEEMLGDRTTQAPALVLSALVGAVVVARAVDDRELSAQILREVREAVTSWRA